MKSEYFKETPLPVDPSMFQKLFYRDFLLKKFLIELCLLIKGYILLNLNLVSILAAIVS